MGRAQGPRQRGGRVVTSPAGLRARRCSRSSRPRSRHTCVVGGCRECGVFFARRGSGGLRFPPPGFPPRSPPFRGAPFLCGSSTGGKTHPRSFASLSHWGQPHGGHFRFFCRRPSAFAKATADTVGSPRWKSPRRSLNTPVPPQSCGGRSRVRRRSASHTAPALRGLR